MKTRRQIASVILNRRNNISPFVMASEMQESLGADSFAEAMRLGWIRPDMETGSLQVTNLTQKLTEMRHFVEDDKPVIGDDVTIAEQGKSFMGKVARVNPDGSYGLTFDPANKPAVTKESYKDTEFQLVKPEGNQTSATEPTPGKPLVRYTPGAYAQGSGSPLAA